MSFVLGYIDDVFHAIVSQPADNLVSFINNAKGSIMADAVNKMGVFEHLL